MRAIIPAAGFGTRVNMPPDKSKEMLMDGQFNPGDPLIKHSLRMCERYRLDPLVITRAEKTDLRNYLSGLGVPTFLVHVTGEWPSTVLKSYEWWGDHNILILPDTRFWPEDCIAEMKLNLQMGCRFTAAVHEVEDSERWGVIKNYSIAEKPKTLSGSQMAWGLMGWNKYFGKRLFEHFVNSQPGSFYGLEDAAFTHLHEFRDVTRTVDSLVQEAKLSAK